MGKQTIVASLNLVTYYFIGLPFGLYLTRSCGWGLEGIWFGVVLSGLTKTLIELFIIFFVIDWQYECQLAAQRINSQEHL